LKKKLPNQAADLENQLAVDRTLMALERTLLAYVRTALALLISGATGFYLSGPLWTRVVAGLLVGLGFVTFALGLMRYRRRKRTLHHFHRIAVESED
jgi:putative membrane protein